MGKSPCFRGMLAAVRLKKFPLFCLSRLQWAASFFKFFSFPFCANWRLRMFWLFRWSGIDGNCGVCLTMYSSSYWLKNMLFKCTTYGLLFPHFIHYCCQPLWWEMFKKRVSLQYLRGVFTTPELQCKGNDGLVSWQTNPIRYALIRSLFLFLFATNRPGCSFNKTLLGLHCFVGSYELLGKISYSVFLGYSSILRPVGMIISWSTFQGLWRNWGVNGAMENCSNA